MASWTRRIPFKVNVAGVIEIMGTSLYSRPDAALRELIQNAHDAVMRRRHRDLNYQGRIDVVQDVAAGTLTFHDDGIGLSAEDAEEYLGTLGMSLTGALKRGTADGAPAGAADLIGQFGIGLFSAFMLAGRLVLESRRLDALEGIRWEAGSATDIELSSCERTESGTTVTLYLNPAHRGLAENQERLETAIKDYADFLNVPLFVNHGKARLNVIRVEWFEPTPDSEAIELALESYFGETPLDVLPLRLENPVIAGALYVTPQRTPGFAGDPVIAVTVRRMVISRRIQGLLPRWASMLRGVLELGDCMPTASREDLIRDASFHRVQAVLNERIFEHFETLATSDPTRWEALVSWHRYVLAGAALEERRLRDLLRRTYKLPTTRGLLTFTEIIEQSPADALVESEAERVVWYNADRRQEIWINGLFTEQQVPCVHALRSFEESLLAAWAGDVSAAGTITDLRAVSPSSPNFAATILGMRDLEDAPPEWQGFLESTGARILCAGFSADQPVMAFLHDRSELLRTFGELKQRGTVPAGFQRLIDAHFEQTPEAKNEVVLNRNHRLVQRVLEQKATTPLASVLRLLVHNALTTAGARPPRAVQREQADDLAWIVEALWGRKG